MGVSVQGEACGVVAQHTGYGLYVHTVLQGQGGEGVAEVMKSDSFQSRPLQYPLEHMQDATFGP